MSEQEPFLTRWVRRKRDAAKAAPTVEPKPETNDLPSPDDAADPVEADGVVRRAPPPAREYAPSSPVFDPAQLPPLDSISAATDIRAFLAPGVPAELTRAALRRAWTADPAIRDFVGLADYDWDFNTPGAIPGFQPLEMTEELRRRITDMVGRNLTVPQTDQADGDKAIADGDKATADAAEDPSNINASMTARSTSRPQSEIAVPNLDADPSRKCEEFNTSISNYTAAQHYGPNTVKQSEAFPRRHGRALPK